MLRSIFTVAFALGAFSAFAEAPPDGESVLRASSFPIHAKRGPTFDCRKSQVGTLRAEGGAMRFVVSTVDYSCDEAQDNVQVNCKVTWGNGDAAETPGEADTLAVVRVVTLDPQHPGTLYATGTETALADVPKTDIDEVAKEFLRDQCLIKIPAR